MRALLYLKVEGPHMKIRCSDHSDLTLVTLSLSRSDLDSEECDPF